jgi:glucose-1-phosphate adenylyltransferase
VQVLNRQNVQEADGGNYVIRDGIVVIPKGAILTDGTVI